MITKITPTMPGQNSARQSVMIPYGLFRAAIAPSDEPRVYLKSYLAVVDVLEPAWTYSDNSMQFYSVELLEGELTVKPRSPK